MIGKTIVNMSTVVKKWKNNDQGLWPLVLSTLVLAIAFQAPNAYSQAPTIDKSKLTTNVPNVSEDADDNTDEENVDQVKSNQTAAPATMDKTSESLDDNTEPAVGQTSNDIPTSAPPVETVPVEPPPVVAEPSTAPQVSPHSVTETVPVEKVTDADMVEIIPKDKTVEVEPRKEYLSYRNRRTTHGFLFSFNAENLYFQDYVSLVDEKLYEELFGQEDLTLLQVQVDYKLNFMLGSLIAGAGFGHGTLIDDRVGEERSLTISKKSLRAQWLLDSLMNEPYFVPYVGASLWQFGVTEENTTLKTSNSYDTGNGTALTVGFLIQLNWLEPQVSKEAYLSQGLENTYLDVFWTQYQNTDDDLDPIFENDFNFGVGLRMEF